MIVGHNIIRFEGEYSFLSNFYWHDGWTVEHGFQAAKTHDDRQKAKILSAPTPGKAKRLGRKATLRADWEDVKVGVMLLMLRKKFENPELRRKLLDTGHLRLIEGNWWHDNEWGDCYCKKCRATRGNNKLGKLLMQVREEIANGK